MAGTVVLTSLLFTLAAAAMGYGMGVLSGPSPRDRFSMAMNFSTRSFGVAAVVGATFMGRTDFLAFMAAFFLTHALLATAAVLLFRKLPRNESARLLGRGRGDRATEHRGTFSAMKDWECA